MTELWGVVVPEAATNLILNPSAEQTGNFGNHNSGSAARDTTYARFGDYCYAVTTGATNRGMTFTVGALANAAHYFTVYARGNAAATLEVSADNSNWNALAAVGGVTGGWVRYGASIASAQCNGSTTIRVRDTANETFYLDGAQLEQAAYSTTYFDGDFNTFCKWTGLRHGSTSTRAAADRSGGRLRTFDEVGSIRVLEAAGHGYVTPQHNIQPMSLQPGAVYQGYKVPPRNLTLRVEVRGAASATPATAVASLHSTLQDFLNLIKPDLTTGPQPFVLFYTGATTTSTRRIFASFVYAGGLDGDGQSGGPAKFFRGPINLLAVDPFWYEDDRVTATLDFTDSLTANYALRRINGAWAALGSGFSGAITCMAVDAERGRVYFGGVFATANGVTVNRVTYWDGTTFNAMGGTAGTSGGTAVNCLAIAANGDVWVGGSFTSAGGSSAKGLARWNVGSSTWTCFNESTSTFVEITAIAIDASGTVYIGGDFTVWEGDAANSRIAKTSNDGTDWDALGTGMNGWVQALAVHPDGKVYVGGSFTTGNGVTLNGIGYWNGTTFVPMGSTAGISGGSTLVDTILVRRNGDVVIGGSFTSAGGVSCAYVAVWNGAAFAPLSTGVDAIVRTLIELPSGSILAGGDFTTAGGLALTDRIALWNGYTWAPLDLNWPGSPATLALAYYNGALYASINSTGGTATAAGITSITNTGLSEVYPDVSVIGPSSSTATLQWLENQTVDSTLYFNLTVNTLETIGVSFVPGDKTVRTLWAGRPSARSESGGRVGGVGGGVVRGNGSASLLTGGGQRFPGIIRGQPLAGSDFLAFRLVPGANTIAAFMTGTTTAAVVLLHFVPRHLSVDGAAA